MNRIRRRTDWGETVIEDGLLLTEGILPKLSTPPVQEDRVTNSVNHVGDLCWCLHSRLQHYSKLGASTSRPGEYLPWTPDGETRTGPNTVTDGCTGTREDGSPCRCVHLDTVSKHSKHAYQRGTQVQKRKLSDLRVGDRVLAGWTATAGKVRLIDVKSGALVVTVRSKRPALDRSAESGLHWTARPWIIETDLGPTVKQTGGTSVGVVIG